VEIARCAIADPALSAVLPLARALVADLAVELETIDLVTNGRGAVVVVASAGERASGVTPRRAHAGSPARRRSPVSCSRSRLGARVGRHDDRGHTVAGRPRSSSDRAAFPR